MDGSCMNNGYENARAGTGVWFHNDDPQNIAVNMPTHMPQSNNTGEALAILMAVKNMDVNDHLEILSDSKLTIESLTKFLHKREDNRWIGTENKEILQAATLHMRARVGQTILTKVKGYSGLEGNEKADKLAKIGVQVQQSPETDTSPAKEHYVEGARLSTATQALLYKGIIEKKLTP